MRGTCEQCKRNDVYIKAIGLCSVCYHLWQGQKDCIVCGQLSWIYARKMCKKCWMKTRTSEEQGTGSLGVKPCDNFVNEQIRIKNEIDRISKSGSFKYFPFDPKGAKIEDDIGKSGTFFIGPCFELTLLCPLCGNITYIDQYLDAICSECGLVVKD